MSCNIQHYKTTIPIFKLKMHSLISHLIFKLSTHLIVVITQSDLKIHSIYYILGIMNIPIPKEIALNLKCL